MSNEQIRRTSAIAGFTLVEVLIAIFILSFGVIAALSGFSFAIARSARGEEARNVGFMVRDAYGQIELLHRLGDGSLLLTYDGDGEPRENYFYYNNPAGGEFEGYYCCYTMLPADENEPLRPEFSSTVEVIAQPSGAKYKNSYILRDGIALVTVRFVRENLSAPIDPRNKPEWPNEDDLDGNLPFGDPVGRLTVFRLSTGTR